MSKLDEPIWTTSSITSSFECNLVGLIFEHLDAALEQPVVSEAGRGDGRCIVRFGGGDDPRAAAAAGARDPLQHPAGRREIGGDHLDVVGVDEVARGRHRPWRQPPHRRAILPLQRPLGLAVQVDEPPKLAHPRALGLGPAHQRIVIRRQPRRRRAVDHQPDIAPRAIGRPPEIIVADVEPADQHARVVGHRQLLVIAEQIAAAQGRVEAAEGGARFAQLA